MAVILNAKGTSQSNFRIGKRGARIYGTSDAPSDVSNISTGDLWFDSSNTLLKIATVSGSDVTWSKLTVGDADTLDGINSTAFARTDQDVTFSEDITISGNLTVSGTTTTVNTQELNIADNEIVLNSDLPSNQPATANAGILINRGNESNVYIRWDEGEGEWTVNGQTFSAGSFVGNLSGNVTGSIAPNGVANSVKANNLIVTGGTSSASFGDNNKANFGAGNDLQIYHDGTNSYIDDAGTGSLFVRSGTTYFQNLAGTKTSIQTNSGGAQTFYHNNVAKLATSATGISVTGTVDVNGAYTLPTSDGTANQILQTDGSGALSFADNSATPGGSNTHVQFNDNGSFGGNSNLIWNNTAERLDVKHLNVSGVFSRAVDYGGITDSADPYNTYDYGGIGEVHEGTEFIVKDNPQLGGNLDAANYNINSIGVATAKSYKDTVFTITDGASVDIDPDNGGIQVWTLGANRTPTATNFDSGAKIMLMIDDGSGYTITWPSVNWVGGVAPTLATSGYSIIELWKVGTQLYGAFAGGVA